MSTTNKNKKKTVSEALLEMDKVSKALKEESKATLSSLLSEAVRQYINEEIAEEDEDENEYSIEDDATENENGDDETSVEDAGAESEEETPADEPETNTEDLNEPEEGDGEEWSGLDDFKVDDDTYDLTTGEKGDETLVKVYKLLKDEDQVVVKQDGDSISLKDGETGAEYVIKTGCEDETPMEDLEIQEEE